MSNEANTILKERCYDEALTEVNRMRLGELLSVVQLSSETLYQIESLIITKAKHKYEELPDMGGGLD